MEDGSLIRPRLVGEAGKLSGETEFDVVLRRIVVSKIENRLRRFDVAEAQLCAP